MVETRDSNSQGESEARRGMYSAANVITLLRLFLVPFFFTTLVSGDTLRSRLVAFALYAIAGSTDWLDGYIARKTNTVTQFGKIVDPLVDRLLLASGVVGLYLVGDLPLWLPVVLVARDAYLLSGAYFLERRSIVLPVTYLGKTTTAVLLVGFSSLIANWPLVAGAGVLESDWLPGLGSTPVAAGMWFVYGGTLLSLTAAVHYTIQGARALAQRQKGS